MINFPAELAHSLEKELRRGWNRQAVTAQIEAKQNAVRGLATSAGATSSFSRSTSVITQRLRSIVAAQSYR
jgi:hypothetical protein